MSLREALPKPHYTLSLVPPDLRQEEQIIQICKSLQHLEAISGDIFDRIGKKISEKKEKLENFDKRIDIIKSKIEMIRCSKKATTVFSSPKYPDIFINSRNSNENSLLNDHKKIFNSINIDTFNKANKNETDEIIIKEKLPKFLLSELLAAKKPLLNAQPISTSGHDYDHLKTHPAENFEGLGKVPPNLQFASSLLLFNTSDYPYKSSASENISSNVAANKSRKILKDDDGGLMEAPSTIRGGQDVYKRLVGDSINYVPALGNVPSLVVPEFLPDLLGVAGDMFYSSDIGPSIAPSIPISVDINSLDLPTVHSNDFIGDSSSSGSRGGGGGGSKGGKDGTDSGERVVMPPPPPPPSSLLPPPPPPPPQIVPLAQTAPPTSLKSAAVVVVASAAATSTLPPPPPPPPTSIPPPPPPSIIQEAKLTKGDQSGSRASLMEAIRGAGGLGGAKLKSAKERRVSEKMKLKVESGNKSGGGGDLMSDLAAKLQLRRKGIMGSQGHQRPRDPLNILIDRVPSIPAKMELKGDDDQEFDWN